MDSLVFCPDCGGVIGGRSPDGVKLCTCEVKPAGPLRGMPNPAEKSKVCCHCGKSLSGKKRFKDSLGYWCEACHYTQKKDEMRDHTPCDGCGRYVEEHKLADYEGLKMCSRCITERKSRGRNRWRVTFGSEHDAQEKRTLVILVVVAAVLLLVIVLASAGLLPALL